MPSGPTPFQARFVTATQQLLALAVVCAALTPAVGVVSLDVVAQAPGSAAAVPGALMSAYGEEALKTAKLPSGPVSAKLREVALTSPATGKALGRMAAVTANARVAAAPDGGSRLTSVPQRVTGYGSVGVTWAHGAAAVRAGPELRGAHPHRRRSGPAGPRSSTTTTTVPTPTAPRAGTPGPAPTRC